MGAYGSLQLSIQPWICAPGTHYSWVDRGSVEYEVRLTLLHMASTGNRTPDLLILSPMPYPLGHVLPVFIVFILHATEYVDVSDTQWFRSLVKGLRDSPFCQVRISKFHKFCFKRAMPAADNMDITHFN